MSLGHGAKIVKNGLVFAYDMGPNPGANKSWKGKPTTNLHTNTDTLSGWYFVDSSYSNGRLIAGTSSAAHFVLQDKSVVSGTVYTQSVEVKHDGVRYFQIAPSTGFSSNFAAFDLVDGTVAGGNTSAASIADIGNGYYRCSYTATATSTTSSGRMAFGPNESSTSRLEVWVGNGANGVFLRNPQIEANSFATPFVNGTRSNTEALLDWTGNNTITADSLIYDSDGTFRFDGSSDYISNSQNIIKTTGGWTIENWFKLDVVNSASLYNFIGDAAITYNSWFWTVYNSKLALWNISPGLWNYGSTTIQPNTWYSASIVCSDSGTQYQFYLNGIAEGGTHSTYTWNSAYAGLQMGYIGRGNSAYSRYFNGQLPSTKVYDRALTAEEITTNFNALRGRYGI